MVLKKNGLKKKWIEFNKSVVWEKNNGLSLIKVQREKRRMFLISREKDGLPREKGFKRMAENKC